MTMPGRTYNAGTGYRYGFNGQEKSNDVTEGNYTAEFWEYDSRTGRRWNTDPVLKPNISSYGTLGNNPIMFVDKNGDDWFVNHLGFYIWSDDANVMLLGFTQYAGTSLPSNVPRYKILTYIETETNFGKQNLLYHKYHYSGLKKFINWLCGAKNITNKEYSPHNEMMSEEFAGMAISYGVFKAAGFAYQAIKASAGSIWKLPGWLERGFVYEAMKGANLPKGFKTIDKFVKGVATSIKTLDLKADTYIKAGKVFGKLKEYIDELDAFKGAKRKGVEVLEQDVKEKVLDVAIPKGATKSQVEEIQKAIQYGKDKGIKVETTVIK